MHRVRTSPGPAVILGLVLALALAPAARAQDPAVTDTDGSSVGLRLAGGCAAGAVGGVVLGSLLPGLGNLIGAVVGCAFGGVTTAAAGGKPAGGGP
jgi:hypothetical protein